MRRLLVFALAGLFGQLVDGALGMAFGVTSSTVLLSSGINPAASSASVHLAEIGTTFTSGLSHWRFGNVSWPLVARIGVPGAAGAFAGATVLSSFTGDWLTPAVAVVLFSLGALVIVRSLRGDLRGRTRHPSTLRKRFLAPLGVSAGFLDAVGGGGWGPVATPTLLTAGRLEPRMVIGSVSASELLVTLAASAGFLIGIGGEGIQASLVLALLAGGVVAAPLAAWLVHHTDASALGVVVGTLLLATNARLIMLDLGTPGAVRLPVILGVAAAGASLGIRTARQSRAEREAEAGTAAGDELAVDGQAALAVEPEVNQELGVVAGVQHHLIRDHTGLERLDAVAETRARQEFVGRRLGEADDPRAERPGEGLVGCQEGDALAVAALVRRLGGTRNSGVQSESRQ